MAVKMFLGFDFTSDAGIPISAATDPLNLNASRQLSQEISVPIGVEFATYSGSFFGADGSTNDYVRTTQGRHADSSALGGYIENSANYNVVGGSAYPNNASMTTTVLRSAIGNPQEVWATFDIRPTNLTVGGNLAGAQSGNYFQIFKWGDLSLRLKERLNYTTTPSKKADYVFEAFNVAASLGTITCASVSEGAWFYVRINARLDSSTNGKFYIEIDGNILNITGINSVATTSLVNATRLYFSGGCLDVSFGGQNGQFLAGPVDNILIDDAAFPAGRPNGRRVSIGSDGTLTNWAATEGGTLTSSLSAIDTNYARGSGTGANALLNLDSITTSGFLSDMIGWQTVAARLKNLDPILVRHLKTGMDVSGSTVWADSISQIVPPLDPSFYSWGYNTDSHFYKTGGVTQYTISDIANTKVALEVTV